MAAIYGRQIRAGKKTIEDVPMKWRAATIQWLEDHPEE